jgi:Spy/CpxP family protein refolding chaperone
MPLHVRKCGEHTIYLPSFGQRTLKRRERRAPFAHQVTSKRCNILPGPSVLKSMKNKRFLAIIAAVAVTVGGLAVYRAHAAPSDRPGHGVVLQRIVKGLDLKDEQLEKIKTELRAEKDALVPIVKNLHESRKALRDAIHASDATETTVRDAAKKVAAAESDLAVERMKLSAKISPILTEEQIEKIKQFEAKTDEAFISALKKIGEALDRKN